MKQSISITFTPPLVQGGNPRFEIGGEGLTCPEDGLQLARLLLDHFVNQIMAHHNQMTAVAHAQPQSGRMVV